MPKTDELTTLKREIATCRRARGPRTRYGAELRERVVRFARSRLDTGEPRAVVARTLGLNRKTLEAWMSCQEVAALVPKVVPVVLEPAPSRRVFSLELGPGRVTGLELDDVIELLRRAQ